MNGSIFYLNSSLIETIEESPDTHLTLSNGNRYLVLEPARVIIDKMLAMQAGVLRRAASSGVKKYLQRRNAENFRPFCTLERD